MSEFKPEDQDAKFDFNSIGAKKTSASSSNLINQVQPKKRTTRTSNVSVNSSKNGSIARNVPQGTKVHHLANPGFIKSHTKAMSVSSNDDMIVNTI